MAYSTVCSKCRQHNPRAPDRRYCACCHAAYMRAWRSDHPLSNEQRRRETARAYARVYKRRGKLIPQPCERCGTDQVEMHHADYDRPLDVTWMCRACHLFHHLQT